MRVFAIKNSRASQILLIYLLFVALRLINLTEPVVDRHSWNQISALNQAKNIYLNPETFWAPETDFLDLHNDSRVYIQEFPLYEGLLALVFQVTGVQEWSARLISIALAFLGLVYAIKIVEEEYDLDTAILSGYLISTCSLAWYFDRTISTDGGMVSFVIMAIYYGRHWIRERRTADYWRTLICALLAGLFKPFGLIALAIIGIHLLRQKRYEILKSPAIYFMGIVCFAPVLLWLFLNTHHQRNSMSGDASLGLRFDILFSVGYYRTLWARFFDNILTVSTFPFFFYFWFSKRIEKSLLTAWLLGLLIYLVLISGGNREHSYYQLLFVAPFCFAAAKGLLVWIRSEHIRFFKHTRFWFVLIMVIATLRGGYYAYNHFKQDRGPYIVGKKIASMNYPKDYRVVYFDPSVTQKNQLIYYSGHEGWNIRDLNTSVIDGLKMKGAKIMGVHLIDESDNFARLLPELKNRYSPKWESMDCVNRYKNRCYMAVIEL